VNSMGNTGLGVWCHGDNSGSVVCIALRDFAKNGQRNSQHFIKVDFSGWKYFAFHEHQNEILPLEQWARKELIYTTYNELQKFYHHYRVNLHYDAIDGVDITVKGNGEIYLRDLRLVPHRDIPWITPSFSAFGKTLKIFTKVCADQILSFENGECTVFDNLWNVVDKPDFTGELPFETGINDVTVTHDGDKTARCKITVTCKGDRICNGQ